MKLLSSDNGDNKSSDDIAIVVETSHSDVTERGGNHSRSRIHKQQQGPPISSSITKASTSSKRPSVILDPLKRRYRDQKVIGLGDGARRSLNPTPPELLEGSKKIRYEKYNGDIPLEDDEKYARSKVERRPIVLVIIGYYTAFKIFAYYLISLSSLITVGLSVGLTVYWYERFTNDPTEQLTGSGMDWVLLGFAVITPLSLSVGIGFRRRERALIEISRFRSYAYQLLLAHCIWDWGGLPPKGKASHEDINWLEHADTVLTELISIGDEMCRFLTLPTASRSRHRMTKSGRREAARTAEIAYRLYDSFYTQRFIKLSKLSEKLKLAGLGASEASRVRQYERWMGDTIENLRMIKTYRTPQTLRSFARLFTTLLPPFFAPQYAELSIGLDSLAFGCIFAAFTALCLNALLEGVEILEDPFVAFVTLDGIDVREEFQVLHYQQLTSARNSIFPEELPYGQANFVTSKMLAGDIESGVPLSQQPVTVSQGSNENSLGNASERKRRQRHRALPSLGDARFLEGLEDDVELYRESGYQLCNSERRRIRRRDKPTPKAPHHLPTNHLPKVLSGQELAVSTGEAKEEETKRPATH